MTQIAQPVLDQEAIQKAVNEAAYSATVKTIQDYYESYKSPYRKMVEEKLNQMEIGGIIELPDVLAVINEKLNTEITALANQVIINSYLPLVKKVLTRTKPQITFSDILKEFIDLNGIESWGEANCYAEENDRHGWIDVKIQFEEYTYEFTLHKSHSDKPEEKGKYMLLSLPYRSNDRAEISITTKDGDTIKMPFNRDVLSDRFNAYLARVVISGSFIQMDEWDFTSEMFSCHCH